MKLESLKSEKFRKLENEEMNKVNGGLAQSRLSASDVSITWTKLTREVDHDCSDCDAE